MTIDKKALSKRLRSKKDYYVGYDIIYEGIKMHWGEEVKARSISEAKQKITEKYKGSPLKITDCWQQR